MKALTITRQVGSWGDYIGVEVAKKMSFRYMDREIIVQAAREAGIPESCFDGLEKQKGMFGRLMDAMAKRSSVPAIPSQALRHSELYSLVGKDDRMRSLVHEGFSQPEAVRHVLTMRFPESRKGLDYISLIKTVVLEWARKGNVVLAGSGSQMLLKDMPGILHVLIIAPREVRIKAIMEQEGVSMRIAEARIRENDAARSAYYLKHYNVDWMDFRLYDLIINTGRIPIVLATDIIAEAYERAA